MIDTQAIRSKILDLAMRGKLTEQLPEDGTAEELYRQIQAEKRSLIKAGKIKKEKPLPEIAADEIPFPIPPSWRWTYLGELFQHNTGKALNSSDTQGQQLEYITTSNLYWNRFELDGLKTMPFSDGEQEKCTVRKGDLLVCEGGDIGRAAIWTYDYEMRIQNHIHRLRRYSENIYPEFYYYLLWLYKQTGRINGIGIGLQGFSSRRVHSLIVPLAPYCEAVRLVEVIKKAFSALDTIDALQAKYADNLAVLKSKLIDAAIQGKLTEQLPEDGTAEELYRQIQAEKQALIKSGKIKKEKPLPEISADEIPFGIPESWNWVRLGAISESVNVGIVIRPTRYYVPQGQGTPAFRNCNIQQGFIDDGEWVYLNAAAAKENPRAVVKNGDISVARSGAPGNCCVVTEPYSGRGAVDIVIVRLHQKLAVPDFIKAFLCSSFVQKAFLTMSRGVALSHLGATTVASLTVSLPPLAEQKRIVAKLEELLPLCERLK